MSATIMHIDVSIIVNFRIFLRNFLHVWSKKQETEKWGIFFYYIGVVSWSFCHDKFQPEVGDKVSLWYASVFKLSDLAVRQRGFYWIIVCLPIKNRLANEKFHSPSDCKEAEEMFVFCQLLFSLCVNNFWIMQLLDSTCCILNLWMIGLVLKF
jgi:hypothetical protein